MLVCTPTFSADQAVVESSGTGNGATRPFTVDGPWEAEFTAKDYFWAFLESANGDPVISAMGGPMLAHVGGHGSYYSPKPGKYYFKIYAVAPWHIRVVRVKK